MIPSIDGDGGLPELKDRFRSREAATGLALYPFESGVSGADCESSRDMDCRLLLIDDAGEGTDPRS